MKSAYKLSLLDHFTFFFFKEEKRQLFSRFFCNFSSKQSWACQENISYVLQPVPCFRSPTFPGARICIQASVAARLWHHGPDDQAAGQLLWDGDPQTGSLPLRHWHQAGQVSSQSQPVCAWRPPLPPPHTLSGSAVRPSLTFLFSPVFSCGCSVKSWSTWSNTLKPKSLVTASRCTTGGRTSTRLCRCPSVETRYAVLK